MTTKTSIERSKVRRVLQRSCGWVLAIVLGCGASAQGAGLLKPKGGEENGLAIQSHQVEVTINNGFAQVQVDQIFHNRTARDMEAIYSFPLPKQASLSELSLWIDGNEVLGEVVEKE